MFLFSSPYRLDKERSQGQIWGGFERWWNPLGSPGRSRGAHWCGSSPEEIFNVLVRQIKVSYLATFITLISIIIKFLSLSSMKLTFNLYIFHWMTQGPSEPPETFGTFSKGFRTFPGVSKNIRRASRATWKPKYPSIEATY